VGASAFFIFKKTKPANTTAVQRVNRQRQSVAWSEIDAGNCAETALQIKPTVTVRRVNRQSLWKILIGVL
jgi:hypothetical protein